MKEKHLPKGKKSLKC